uniref:Cadherin-2-like n=1 Tax=Phascolarctos cinereus TaxID=38626 RepID=A0A6P5K536_PHACI|nr:cadherin-2-like [Phascolarctos cinereus]
MLMMRFQSLYSGVITISQPLDYDDPAIPHFWILKIRAYDNDRVHSTTGTLTVILQDVNDNPPQCTQDRYVIELPENPLETRLVSLICTDKDGTDPNNNITYHLIVDKFSNEIFTLTNNEIKPCDPLSCQLSVTLATIICSYHVS